ncbi:alpha/beta hydrolase-fold protein [Ekhidna sp.]|uniref:alpha/beta hydrolase-fold protein n=1 Tax=Ekhidna sp. TaxID=2608089 RepID=UPI003298A820
MKRTHFLTICLCFLVTNLFAQSNTSVGETHRINSNGLSQEIELQIYLPQSYMESKDEYPTLYILDGQWYYTNGVAIQESLRGNQVMPKMIVVGINMVDRPYRSELFNKWDAFITFIESELVPYVDKSFRTSDDRIIFGWENSGFLTSELILRKDSPFTCAIASSGSYISKDLLGTLSLEEERFFFIAGSKKDIYSIDDTDQTAQDLGAINTQNLNWKYELFNEEEHETMGYASMYHGLKFFYHNYGSLVFGTIDELEEKGGIPFMEKYFKERGERFDLPTDIDASTKNSLIWLAWKRDNFEAFDMFMNEFSDVLSTRRYANAYWQNRLGQYYLKYESFDKAISFFDRGIDDYSEDRFLAEMYAGLGLAYQGKGEKKLARKNLKKAVDIASENEDSKTDLYQNQLDDLK